MTLTTKQEAFLKSLGKELLEQDTDYQASPIFWVIRQNERRVTDHDFADGVEYTYNDGDLNTFKTVDEFMDFLKEHFGFSEEIITYLETYDSLDDLYYEIRYAFHHDYGDIGEYLDNYSYEDIPTIVPNTMFMTKADAVEHLKLNKHNYNSSAHTYAMTAHRSPSYDRLLKLLKEIGED